MVRKEHNTPAIIKYPFWQMVMNYRRATYACINFGEAVCPDEIQEQAICVDRDLDKVLSKLIS